MQARMSRLSRRGSALVAAGAIAVAMISALAPAAPAARHGTAAPGRARAAAGPPAALRMGSVRLSRCGTNPRTFCGGLAVPLDYSSPASPRIHIGFRWLPATRHPQGTILAVEGGPGYASTGSQPAYLDRKSD